jgi:hypothetical protein
MTATARTTTATRTATTARTTAMMAATATALGVAVVRSVGMSVARLEAWLVARSVAWLVAVFFAWRLHTVGIVQTCFGINLFWSKLIKMIPTPATSSQRAPRELPGSSQRAPISKP